MASKYRDETPLKFHQIHGINIVLQKNETIAFRMDGYNDGIAFTNRPVKIKEPISFRIKDTSTTWSGAVRIGFTNNDPNSMKSKVPSHSCPDLVGLPGNWAKTLPEALNNSGSVISYFVDEEGNMYYQLNKEKERFLVGGIKTSSKLWGVIDVYGNTISIELLDHKSIQKGKVKNPRHSKLAFHHTHGKTAILKNNKLLASRKSDLVTFPYVFSNKPMKFETDIIIQILNVGSVLKGPLEYGVTSCDPSTILEDSLPEDTKDLLDWCDYWVFHQDFCHYSTKDLIIFQLNSDGKLKVLKNLNSVSTILHVDTSQPLWLFLKLSGSVTDIYMMGSFENENDSLIRDFATPTTISPEKDCENMTEDFQNLAVSSKLKNKAKESSFNECIICCEKPVNCAFYRCGHMCMCYECAQTKWRPKDKDVCPICRQSVQDIIKIYA